MKPSIPWIVGIFLAIVYFGTFETLAFMHPDKYTTLSHFTSTIGASWPLSIYLMGMFSGILAAHFFWPWQANPLGKGGG